MVELSVIIPTFNRLWSLPKAVESCRGLGSGCEIIVVDDGSEDGTWEWLQTQNDIIAIRQENQGKCWAVNKGITVATGAYVRFLDSDDWLHPNTNKRQVGIAKQTNSDLVLAGYEIRYEASGETVTRNWIRTNDLVSQFLGECDSSHYSAFLFRREALEDIVHRPDFAFRDDRIFMLEFLLREPNFAIDEEIAFTHRHHGKERLQVSVGMQQVVTNYQHINLYRRILSTLDKRGQLSPRRAKAATNVLWVLAHWIAYTHPDEGCELANWVKVLNPDFKAPERGILGFLYRRLGFKYTERILFIRRRLKNLIRYAISAK